MDSELDMLKILAAYIPIVGPEVQITMHQKCGGADIPNVQRLLWEAGFQQQESHEKDNQRLPEYPLRCLGNDMIKLALSFHCIFSWV